jgi:hypothetical protein
MPYDLTTKSGLVLRNIPDHISPDAPELKALAQKMAPQQPQEDPRAARIAQMKRDNPGEYDPESAEWRAKYGPGEAGVLANLGAGFANLGQGARQLAAKVGIGEGVSDEEVLEKRRIDEQAAGDSLANKGLQIAGEVLPTLVLPGAAMARPLQALGRTTSVLGAGAAANAAGAALAPVTSDESRGMNMATAGLIGAALPGAGTVVGKGLNKTVKAMTESGANRRAIEAIAEYVPTDAREALARRLAGFEPPSVKGTPRDIPTTAAQATGDARLAQAEAASRARPHTSTAWDDFDSARNAEVFGAVEDMAPSDLRIDRLERVRAGRTAPLREQAMAEAAQRGDYVAPVLAHADNLLAGDTGANTAVAKIANYVKDVIGEEATPGRLYEARKFLAQKLSGPAAMGDDMAAAAKGANRETMGMIAAIDDALAGGQKAGSTWDQYLTEYGTRSKPITSGRALQKTLAEMAEKPLRGTTPEVTYTGLKTALKKNSGSKYGDKLASGDRTDATALLEHLRSAEGAGRSRKLAGTMGGGSQTNLDSLLAGFTNKTLRSLPAIGGYVGRLDEFGRESVEAEMARLLQDPRALAQALEAMPPSRREQTLIDLMRASNVGAGGAAAAATNP